MRATDSQVYVDTALKEIAWLSSQNKEQVYHSLMHHINVNSLRSCFERLDGNKAIGADKISKEMYGENLEQNLGDLIARMKRMAYKPGPVRQVLIAKEGKPGATRPLGISNLEDKLVQKRTQEILESVYDPIFLKQSYGFRSGRGSHDAIRDLKNYLYTEEVETVIDVDLDNFFGTIDHTILLEIIKIKIKDTKFLRYLSRMLKSGVLTDGELIVSEEGVPQGSICSPILSNILAHHVIDIWLEETVKPLLRGKMEMFRYADDLVICCRYEADAIKIRSVLAKRLAKYKLKLNEDKTKLVSFSKRKVCAGLKQGTFNFLGFTFYYGRTRTGRAIPKLKTEGKRFRAKLKRVNEWARNNRNRMPLRQLWSIFCKKIRGHIQYYGVSFNYMTVSRFVYAAKHIILKWINRRSQRKSFCWEKFKLFMQKFPMPIVKIYHKLF